MVKVGDRFKKFFSHSSKNGRHRPPPLISLANGLGIPPPPPKGALGVSSPVPPSPGIAGGETADVAFYTKPTVNEVNEENDFDNDSIASSSGKYFKAKESECNRVYGRKPHVV